MGCSPSKGQLFGGAAGPHSLLPSPPEGDRLVLKPGEGEHPGSRTDEGSEDLLSSAQEESLRSTKTATMVPAIVSSPEGVADTQVNMESQERDTQGGYRLIAEKQMTKVEKRRNIKGSKQGRLREKGRNSSVIRTKVDLPVHMVKAHQAAYAYLNPNISKYETLLGLLDHAAQTQLSLQPMMTAIVQRFEEVNQALEEMAEEGELMLKGHGDHMAWPSGMRVLPPVPTKPCTGTSSSDPPPDLLQQMLQHSTEKMRSVGSSVHSLGDNTLEEAVEYFASLSKLLSERLQNKRAAEGRLTQVLARVEAAAMRKSTPEDSALHSEDSGIGGENESLAGSERYRRHRGSSGSGGSAHITLHCPPNQVCLNEGEEEEEEDDDDYEDEEDEKEEDARSWRKRSNSSPPDPSQPVLPVPPKHSQGQQPRRPLTAAPAARLRHSQSTECLNSLLELQKNQGDLDQRMRKMADGGASNTLYRAGLRSQSSGPLKTNQTASSLPVLAVQRPGRHSVRRLINTFSKGVDGRPGQSLANIPPHIRGSKRNRTPLFPDTRAGEGGVINNGINNNNGWSVEGREDMDMDSLPPPPPEVLMDNSFQSTVETSREEEGLEEDSGRGRPTVRQRSGISLRLKAAMPNVTVLPNRGSAGGTGSLGIPPAHPVRQESVVEAQHCQGTEPSPQADADPEKEQAANLYRQARKIIHLRNAAESPAKRSPADQGPRVPSPLSAGVSLRQGNRDYCEVETYACSHRPTTPPVSRVRLPPACTSVHHRLPSPPAHKDQPTCPSSGQWRSPSRPGSPRIKTWARENSGEENSSLSPSMSFSEARLVFCQNSQTWTPSCSSTLLSPCGDLSQGRLPSRRPQTSVRHSQADGRPRPTTQAEPSVINSTDRLNSASMTEEDSQSDPSDGAQTHLNPDQ